MADEISETQIPQGAPVQTESKTPADIQTPPPEPPPAAITVLEGENRAGRGMAGLSAKAMNQTGISSEWMPVLEVSFAGLNIAVGHMKILNRLDKLIAAQHQATQPPKPENKK